MILNKTLLFLSIALPLHWAVFAAWHVALEWIRFRKDEHTRKLAAEQEDRIELVEGRLAGAVAELLRVQDQHTKELADVRRVASDIAAAVNYRRRS